LFRAWGRLGTTIGGNKLESYNKKDDVLREFLAIYLDKTGNEWDSRKNADKKPNKFYPLEIDYGDVLKINLLFIFVLNLNQN
jgi:poly [ADP-ribose] polymerase